MHTLDRPSAPHAPTDPDAPATGTTGAPPRAVRSDSPTPPPPPPTPSGDPTGPPRRGLVAVALVAALSGAAVATPIALLVDGDGATAAPATTAAEPDREGGEQGADAPVATGSPGIDVVAVAEAVSPSVVRIDVGSSAGAGTGSGVVFDDEGHIVTNNHVVGQADRVRVTLSDGRRLDADVVGTDPATDLAVVAVDDADLVAVPLADGPPAIGSPVVAIGSPFGLDGSVTSGIVSALDREVGAAAIPLTGLVQTDAAVNPGNSGGALVDADGELVGINTAIASSGGGSDGIGFAIDAATVESVATDLIADGAVQRSWLGVAGTTPVGADGRPDGALVQEVLPASPAEAAGLQPGDRIVALDDDPVETFPDLAARLVRLDPDDRVTLRVDRDGRELDLDVTLGEATP